MARKNRILTNHHIIPKHLGGNLHTENKLRLYDIKHRALHILLDENGKAQAPIEQLSTLFEIIKKPLVGDVKNEISKILELYKQAGFDIYNQNCINY